MVGHSALWRAYKKVETFYFEPHTLWQLPNEIIDIENITFVLLAYWVRRKNIKEILHRHSIADGSQGSLGTSVMDHPNHWRNYHSKFISPMFTRTCWEHHRCVADVSHQMFGAVRRYIADGH